MESSSAEQPKTSEKEKKAGKQRSGKSGRVRTPDLQDLYINRELSWLEFNARVLSEALLTETPLLERLKFLAIFGSNFDEFFMVRVAGLMKMHEEGLRITESPDRMDTGQVLTSIRKRVEDLLATQYRCLHDDVLPKLAKEGAKIVKPDALTTYQRAELDRYFSEEISPVLTPLAFDPAHPFPFLSNQALYLIVIPKDSQIRADRDEPVVGFVEIPSVLPRLIPVKTKVKGDYRFVLLEDLIGFHLSDLFYGYDTERTYTVRVTRNLDYNLLENKVVDLLKTMQKEVISREHQEVVRLEVEEELPENILALLQSRLEVRDDAIYKMPRPLYIPGLMQLYKLPKEHLKEKPFNPRLPLALASNEDIFSVIARQDLLVHHPYDSFYAVVEFLMAAAKDSNVLAIKQTLYRTAGDSPIIDALIIAAEHGKQVTAVVELKARFDEKNNIVWARRLERAGVNVVFGFVGLKTHGKACLVVRREKGKLMRYVHLATGNYNSSTAKLYTDIGLFTNDEAIGRDVSSLFNLITGFDVLTGEGQSRKKKSVLPKLEKLAFAPLNMRETFLALIRDEIECKRRHGSGLIMAKMNALVDRDIIDALYEASAAGVQVRLIVRGICCLRPGLPGISENIEVVSILDRFLEHPRIYYFQAAGQHKVYLSSADWMPRNMERRIEIMFPVEKPAEKQRVIEEILGISWADNVKAHRMLPDGTYERRQVNAKEPVLRSQTRFIELAREEGIKSIPYEVAIRYKQGGKGERPVAKKGRKKG